jgi:hypothetical protein
MADAGGFGKEKRGTFQAAALLDISFLLNSYFPVPYAAAR